MAFLFFTMNALAMMVMVNGKFIAVIACGENNFESYTILDTCIKTSSTASYKYSAVSNPTGTITQIQSYYGSSTTCEGTPYTESSNWYPECVPGEPIIAKLVDNLPNAITRPFGGKITT
jgi:hypothetical protein